MRLIHKLTLILVITIRELYLWSIGPEIIKKIKLCFLRLMFRLKLFRKFSFIVLSNVCLVKLLIRKWKLLGNSKRELEKLMIYRHFYLLFLMCFKVSWYFRHFIQRCWNSSIAKMISKVLFARKYKKYQNIAMISILT